MLSQSEKQTLIQSFEGELRGNILPWWMQHTVDRENGGFYGAVTQQNEIKNDFPRSLVLTARILWAFSAAYRAFKDPAALEMACHAYRYLTTAFWDGEFGGCYWMVDRHGHPMDTRKQSYGQGFAIYGLSEYALALREKGDRAAAEEALDKAKAVFFALQKGAYDPKFGGYVEARARDWSPTGSMALSEKESDQAVKSMNTMLHIVEPLTNLVRAWDDPLSRDALRLSLRAFLDHVINPATHTTILFFDEAWNPIGDHISFGHDIEASWLLVEAAEVLGDEALVEETRALAVKMAEAAKKAIEPDGSLLYEASPRGFTVVEKHWWAQAEGMVGFYNAAQVAEDPVQADEFTRISMGLWDYIRARHVDRVHGDWFKGLNREGMPLVKSFKAGPWDCPYHHVRACLEMMRRLKE